MKTERRLIGVLGALALPVLGSDLDNCFGGSWQVSRGAFARVRDQIAASGPKPF